MAIENGKIIEFKNESSWLSNMAMCIPFKEDGIFYNTVEAYYQAHKSTNLGIRVNMSKMNAYYARNYGQSIKKRSDWEHVKDEVMETALRFKFGQRNYQNMLINTGTLEIIHGNYHNDTYWGYCLKTNKGQDKLGKLLVKLRAELMEQIENKEHGGQTIERYPNIKKFLDMFDYGVHDKAVIGWIQSNLIDSNPNYALVESEIGNLTEDQILRILDGQADLVPTSKVLYDLISKYPEYVNRNKTVTIF